MYLIFTDETGTNTHNSSNFLMYGGIVVHESIVLKLEMQIIDIVSNFLNINNMLEAEVHFTEIFNYVFHNKKPSKLRKQKEFDEQILPKIKDKSKEEVIKFVAELFQLISKANTPLFFSNINKNDEYHDNYFLGNKEISCNAYAFKAFLNIVDRFLTNNKEMGLLVADDFNNQLPKNLKNLTMLELISNNTIKNNPTVKEIIYKRVLAESLVWKNKFLKDSFDKSSIAPLKYTFESNSFNIIDNISFVSSKDSIINQITDILLYTIRKIKEYNLNKERYIDIKDFCENSDLVITINDLYYDSKIIEGIIKKVNNQIDIMFIKGHEANIHSSHQKDNNG